MSEIRYIFHISDIHISSQNFVNIRQSFYVLIQDIIKLGIEQSMLVIAGDIFEHKTSLSTDELFMFKDICRKLNEYKINTLMIPGNHDYNINSYLAVDNVSTLFYGDTISCYNTTSKIQRKNIEFYIYIGIIGTIGTV